MPQDEDCIVPPAAQVGAIQQVAVPVPEHQRRSIADYVEGQCNKGDGPVVAVIHLEQVKAETIFGTEHVVWDVHTDEPSRWWVITSPTNLYSQALFPSLDYTLSFHVGLMARIAANQAKEAPESRRDRLRAPWRRWETATAAIDEAQEAEDFQAVGMRCRETLLSAAKTLQRDIELAPGAERPKAADFVAWSGLIARHFASGGRREHIRSYLIATAKETWGLANWLTHSSSATLHEAHLALDATGNWLQMLSLVVMHSESGAPDSCSNCGSYRIIAVYDNEIDRDPPYYSLCESCGWNDQEGEIANLAGGA